MAKRAVKPEPRKFDNEDERNLHQDLLHKQVFPRKEQHLAEALSRLMTKRGYAQVQTAACSAEAWRKAAGAELAQETQPGQIKRGVLEVIVRHPAVVQELTFVKAQLVKKLSQLIPEQKIRDLKFRVGAVR
jgi:predicted nucleic acid-binding Zn ribbon protein